MIENIALVLLIVAWFLFPFLALRRYASDRIEWYESTDHIGCIMNHRHLWKQVSEFPETLEGSAALCYITIYECPVCVTEEGRQQARVDNSRRHK